MKGRLTSTLTSSKPSIANTNRMPEDAKKRVLAQLQQDRVPLQVIERLEQRMGG